MKEQIDSLMTVTIKLDDSTFVEHIADLELDFYGFVAEVPRGVVIYIPETTLDDVKEGY